MSAARQRKVPCQDCSGLKSRGRVRCWVCRRIYLGRRLTASMTLSQQRVPMAVYSSGRWWQV